VRNPATYLFVLAVLMVITFGIITADVNGPARTVQIVLKALGTGVMLVSSLVIVVRNRYAPKDKYWAFTTIGIVLGYWLHV